MKTNRDKTIHLPTFSFDRVGDVEEIESGDEGIYLHFGNIRIRVASNLIEFSEFILQLRRIEKEIEDNY